MTFGTVLVANRGEIAVRVLRAARAAGLRTVAVFSDADREAPHVREADTAVRIGPAPAAESYLSIPALIEAARRSGAEAVHPGYGFLSERAAFARAVIDAGLVFIGPGPDVIELMGRKDAAREIAIKAGVPVVPSYTLAELAEAPRFPVLVKAAAGGGGKGMRIVRQAGDLDSALASARREALSAFGDDTMLIERFLEHGRHVEVQILADEHGTVLHLFERDCSVQRRHQKVLEEAPAPTIDEQVRTLLLESAVRLSRSVGYVNAGTVEFLVAGQEAYFLEMNTRLQVEHPVTELVTGLDLVQLQILVAQGRRLPLSQADVTLDGHAIEARVYAEDPYRGFLPQAGTASLVHWSERARIDAALESGQTVETHYDPLLGKVIVHGQTREAARRALVGALDDTAILGLTTNLGFLRQVACADEYRDCEIDTGWLDRHAARFGPSGDPVTTCIAAWAMATALTDAQPREPFGLGDGWRAAGPPTPVTVELADEAGDSAQVLRVDLSGGRVLDESRAWEVRTVAATGGVVRLQIDGTIHEAYVEVDPHGVTVAHQGQSRRFLRPDTNAWGGPPALADGGIRAPMPGTVLAVHVAAGRPVQAGELLVVMEAMKMELSLKAPFGGVVSDVAVAAGARVALGQRLLVVTGPDGN
jgi:3-methylcrotonyl-CoA carboxylase alpha subunit/acetyl-CoA/propionyl-CoA carboxylase biotin carboxyl carrier protein